MTEEEARTKWCPMVRFAANEEDSAANRWPSLDKPVVTMTPDESMCIASDCMMWVWSDATYEGATGKCGLIAR